MSIKVYERQHLACFAAGAINDAGTSQVNFGCGMTRIGTGHYGLILDASSNLIDSESFTFATPKTASGQRAVVVEDASASSKVVRVFNSFGTITDCAIEVALFRTVTR